MKAVLTIAGSDSSGGAGIQADLRTFAALNMYGTSAITALTAQNTTGVQAVHGVPPEFVKQQISSIFDDIHVEGIKTGMLFDVPTTLAVVEALRLHRNLPPLVIDPVCVSTSGHSLLHPDAIEVMKRELFPLATLITPNKAEAELLLERSDIISLEDMILATSDLLLFGCGSVLLKGGHFMTSSADLERVSGVEIFRDDLLNENMEILQVSNPLRNPQLVVDVLQTKEGHVSLFVRPKIETTSTHGTGCTLSAALACELARGATLVEAVRTATVYTHHGIYTAIPFGKGNGPLNHLHAIHPRVLPLPTPTAPYPLTYYLISDTAPLWKAYVEHDFVQQLGRGTLPISCFKHFIREDYTYLLYYSRAYALLAAKATSFTQVEAAATVIMHINREIKMHRRMCDQFGVFLPEGPSVESEATRAYGAWLIDVGVRGDAAMLEIALLACLLGYGEVGLWLKKQTWVKLAGNPYLQWIEDYSGVEYQDAVKRGLSTIENRAQADPPSIARLKEWRDVWETCTRLERNFWDSALRASEEDY